MRRFFAFYFFLFKTRLAKAFGCVFLIITLCAAYIAERVKIYSLLDAVAQLEKEKTKLEENIDYSHKELARSCSLVELFPRAQNIGLDFPGSRKLASLPLHPMLPDELWERAARQKGLWATIRQKFPLKEAAVSAQEFKNGR